MNGHALNGLSRWPADAPALAWPGGGMDYGRLRAEVDALARHAAALGAPDSPLAVLTAAPLGRVLGVLAALRLGRPALPLDPARPDVAACLAVCAPGGVLDDGDLQAAAGGAVGGALAPIAGRHPPVAAEAAATIAAEAAPTAAPSPGAMLLVPTSGTSGAVQVAMLSVAALEAHVAASARMLPPLGPADRWLVCLPMSSIGALAALWRTLSAGACLAFLQRFDAAEAREMMVAGASHVSVVPAMLAPLAAGVALRPRALRCLLAGGGPLSADSAGAARARDWPLWTGWGMTETASHVAACAVDDDWREGIVGRPLPGVDIEVDPGSGRLRVTGPMLMSGYARPGLAPGSGLDVAGRLATGDLGEWLDDGRLRVLGRADDVIVTGGVNVHPEAVENRLSPCPGIGEVAVAGLPDVRWGSVLVALYTGELPARTVEAWARAHLPSASRPREFRRVAALPRNAMGKLQRGSLPELLAGRDPGKEQGGR